MSEVDLFKERFFGLRKKGNEAPNVRHMTSKEISSAAKFDGIFSEDGNTRHEPLTPGNWCEVVSLSLSNVNAKQAWKNGTDRLSQTLNNVKSTFGVLSQRIKKSTKKRQPLVNMESPTTPYTRSRAALGRTPTKLYSPFSIDTPTGKENIQKRFIMDQTQSLNMNMKGGRKKPRRTKLDLGLGEPRNCTGETILSSDLLETQIGIYEFQSVANRILQSGLKK